MHQLRRNMQKQNKKHIQKNQQIRSKKMIKMKMKTKKESNLR